ncbi:MAG TPA: SDR family NAD(P)-dependent oxidoreductase [Acidobacteriaceae bacterium]|jgi:uncharacterized oxidoreductase|nr:SDR family NAD(P)-dependent oxidoreductase [Acidobacteriaceae bacterium]
MQTTGNTILITGGGTGIGRALAEAFHALGNKVIVAGRREQPLQETAAANPGIEWLTLDVQNAPSVTAFAQEAIRRFPALNAVIHNAGIMQPEDLLHTTGDTTAAEAMIHTNLTAPLRLTAALMPHLLKQPHAAILTVSSGLAFVPMAITPTYNATKAAIHSWTQSLRFQLRKTKVEVLEIIPPYVQTELMGPGQAADPRAMPLAEFIAEVMELIAAQPASGEIAVKRVYPLRFAGDSGEDKEKGRAQYDAFVTHFNNQMLAPH